MAVRRRCRGGLVPFAAAAVALATSGRDALSQGIQVDTIARDAWVLSGYSNGNVLVVATGAGLVLVDGQSAERVAQADSVIRTLTDEPVRLVISTHYHSDHIGGNPYWRARGARVVGHSSIRCEAARDTMIAGWDNWHRRPEPPDAFPDQPFTDHVALTMGRANVIVWHPREAHTGGDAVVRIRRDGLDVVHTGDIVELGAPPFIDWWAGGTAEGMLGGLELIADSISTATLVVPGHGPVSGRAEVLAFGARLSAAVDTAKAAVARAEPLSQLLERRPLVQFEAAFGGPRRTRHLLRLLHLGVSRPWPPTSECP